MRTITTFYVTLGLLFLSWLILFTNLAAAQESLAVGPLDLKVGQTWIVSRQTQLMPAHSPSDIFFAIKKMKTVPVGGGFTVLEIYDKQNNRWYRASAFDKNRTKMGSGWINSDALFGQKLIAYTTPSRPDPLKQKDQEVPPVLPQSTGFPSHQVASNTPLMQGRRIEIHADDPHLTKAQCNALIDAYRAKAGSGQVSVRKPNE